RNAIMSARGCARVGPAAILAVGLAACQPTVTPTPIPNAVTGQNPADVQYFQNAVEKTPKDVTAWVGLAASYDRLGRFDLADRSYAAAVKLVGHNTPSLLNNEGYSYMLRGDLGKARA